MSIIQSPHAPRLLMIVGGQYKARGKAAYEVDSLRKAIRSFLSFSFFRPPKAILVPGMYFLGFSRYSKRVFSFHSMPFCLLASV
jgi:hypothetical protein